MQTTRQPSRTQHGDLIRLKDGPAVPWGALELAIDLDLRGVRLAITGGRLTAGPRGLLTETDVRAIHRWHHELTALVFYCKQSR